MIRVNDLEERIREILANVSDDSINAQNINLDENLFEAGFDSIMAIKVIVKIEELFDIQFDDTELSFENIESINSMISMIYKKIKH
ncbi:acyl carrier protein [Virgibacillus sp. NKC19-3]|uniref:acyl carrier protein n=1 Tax=Virgibacillus saliphilus TaxID=2831674 RepID=UPI001C9AEFC8|nr:acyl carrier protein [Virgibacillus sp. NKC19-3]MBY7142463.1 acyl carrier protein [Virgibacillus sp. NKC19-3]